LFEIEREEGVRIFYACESGSRAWGFASEDSDYDVRFLYAHPPPWYLSIDVEEKSDVIERPAEGQLDVIGWDLRKALKLFRKSNPPLLEWLRSPIVYSDKFEIAEQLRSLLPEYYSPTACLFHYLHMAQGNYREYLQGDVVWVKKYLYVLRPLLAIQWIEEGRGVVPMEFETLLNELVQSPDLKREILLLLERKKAGNELDRGPRIPLIGDYIQAEMARLEAKTIAPAERKAGNEKLNELFRSALSTVWRTCLSMKPPVS
jgi:predicted nucleotidyltransferase